MASTMTLQDDRTAAEKITHTSLIGGTDSFMSGWGKASDGPSYAFWACRPEDADAVEAWVRDGGDMQRVREVGSDYRPSRDGGHCHIYVVHEAHAALRGWPEDTEPNES